VDLLNEPGVVVLVPNAVLDELGTLGPDDPAAVTVRSTPIGFTSCRRRRYPTFFKSRSSARGETAVLALALAEPGPDKDVVIDDWKARRRAEGLGIGLRGTLAYLLIAKNLGPIESLRPLLEQLRQSGMYLSDELMHRPLKQAGE
jgi:predicted nucleic acid-binding protein